MQSITSECLVQIVILLINPWMRVVANLRHFVLVINLCFEIKIVHLRVERVR